MPITRQKRQQNAKTVATKFKPESTNSRSILIEVAQKHFGLHGYQAASVHDMARDANLNVSLVSYHFGGKKGLFRECFAEAGLARLEMAERILMTTPSSIDEVRVRLSMFIDEMLLDAIKNPEIFSIINRELSAEFDILGDVFQKTFFRTFELLSKFIGMAKDAKFLAVWVDPNLTAVHLIGSIMHTIRTDQIRSRIFRKSITDPAIRAATRDYLLRIFLEGITYRNER